MALLSRPRFALDTRIATVMLASIIAVVSMPMLCGVVVARAHSAIAIEIDICHQLQATDATPAMLFAPPPAVFQMAAALPAASGLMIDREGARLNRLGDAPDPPPPESPS
jgi:hypothetical protein